MPAADQRSQHVFDDRVLPDHRFLQFSAQRLSKLTGALGAAAPGCLQYSSG